MFILIILMRCVRAQSRSKLFFHDFTSKSHVIFYVFIKTLVLKYINVIQYTYSHVSSIGFKFSGQENLMPEKSGQFHRWWATTWYGLLILRILCSCWRDSILHRKFTGHFLMHCSRNTLIVGIQNFMYFWRVWWMYCPVTIIIT